MLLQADDQMLKNKLRVFLDSLVCLLTDLFMLFVNTVSKPVNLFFIKCIYAYRYEPVVSILHRNHLY